MPRPSRRALRSPIPRSASSSSWPAGGSRATVSSPTTYTRGLHPGRHRLGRTKRHAGRVPAARAVARARVRRCAQHVLPLDQGRGLNVARRIRMPGIVDLMLVDEPAEIRRSPKHPSLDRRFVRRGPLVNRLIAGRIRRWFHHRWSALALADAAQDAVRAERQRQLADSMPPAAGRPLWSSDAQLDRLADPLSGHSSRDDAASPCSRSSASCSILITMADRASWEAAELIDRFRDGFSPIQIVWLITGRLRTARRLLLDRARWDRWACMAARSACTGSCTLWKGCGPARCVGGEIARRRRRLGTLSGAAAAGAPGRDAMLATPVTAAASAARYAGHVAARRGGAARARRRDGVHAWSLERLSGASLRDRAVAGGVAPQLEGEWPG